MNSTWKYESDSVSSVYFMSNWCHYRLREVAMVFIFCGLRNLKISQIINFRTDFWREYFAKESIETSRQQKPPSSLFPRLLCCVRRPVFSKWESSILVEGTRKISSTTTTARPRHRHLFLDCTSRTNNNIVIKRKVIGTKSWNHGAHILKVVRTYGKNYYCGNNWAWAKAAHILQGRPVVGFLCPGCSDALINKWLCLRGPPSTCLAAKNISFPRRGWRGWGGVLWQWRPTALDIRCRYHFSGGGSCRGKVAVLTMPQLGYPLIGGS